MTDPKAEFFADVLCTIDGLEKVLGPKERVPCLVVLTIERGSAQDVVLRNALDALRKTIQEESAAESRPPAPETLKKAWNLGCTYALEGRKDAPCFDDLSQPLAMLAMAAFGYSRDRVMECLERFEATMRQASMVPGPDSK